MQTTRHFCSNRLLNWNQISLTPRIYCISKEAIMQSSHCIDEAHDINLNKIFIAMYLNR